MLVWRGQPSISFGTFASIGRSRLGDLICIWVGGQRCMITRGYLSLVFSLGYSFHLEFYWGPFAPRAKTRTASFHNQKIGFDPKRTAAD